MSTRIEVDVITGAVRQINTKAYMVDGAIVLIDDGDDVPTGAVLPPSAPTQQPQAPVFSILEFLDLFTDGEQLVIVEASMQSAPIKLWYDRTLAASFVTISDRRVSDGLSALVAANLLTMQRKEEIIAAMSA